MSINEVYKAPLSNLIQKEYNKLISLVKNISTYSRIIKKIDGTGGKISISDLIAYQIGWGKLLINWYEIGLHGKKPQMPGEGFEKWDYVGLAEHFYKKCQYDSHIKQDQEFYKVVEKIIAITEHEYEKSNLDKKGIWDWCTLSGLGSGEQWPLSKWIIVNTASPYKKAIRLIRKLNKKQKVLLLTEKK